MLKKHASHMYYYLVLVIVFAVLAVYAFLENTKLGYMYAGIFASVFYVGWAIIHHHLHHDVHLKVVVEYVIIGVLGISVVYFMLSIY